MRRYLATIALSFCALFACNDEEFIPTSCSTDADCLGSTCVIATGATYGYCSATCVDGCGGGDPSCTNAADCAGFACVVADGSTEAVCSTDTCGAGFTIGTDTITGALICVAGGGCTSDDDCGAYACDTTSGACYTECTDGSECSAASQCDDTATPGQCIDGAAYLYIAVVSRAEGSDALDNPNPGPDIDAISISAGGVETFASVVESSVEGAEGDEQNLRPLASHAGAVTAKDTVVGGVCDLDAQPGYVAIGGAGGFIVVSFPREVATGDTITVYEINSDYCSDAATERPDTYDVYVSDGESATGVSVEEITTGWCLVGSQGGTGGVFMQVFDAGNCAL